MMNLALVATVLAPVIAVSTRDIAEVERRAGQVDIRPPALATDAFNQGWQPVMPLAYVEKQGWTRTYQRAQADCRSLSGGVECRIGPRTLISIQDFVDSPDEVKCIIWMPEGAVRTKVPPTAGKQRKYEVRTNNSVLSARGTEWVTQYVDPNSAALEADPFDGNFNLGAKAGETRMVVLEGTVEVMAKVDGEWALQAAIQPGQAARIDAQSKVFTGAESGLEYQGDRKVKILETGEVVDLSDAGLNESIMREARLQGQPSPLTLPEPGGRTIERGTFTEAGGGIRGDGGFQSGGVPLQINPQPPSSSCAPPSGGNCAAPCMP